MHMMLMAYVVGQLVSMWAFGSLAHYSRLGWRLFCRDLPWIVMVSALWPIVMPILLWKSLYHSNSK